MSIPQRILELQNRLDSDDELIQVSKIKLVQLLSEIGISQDPPSQIVDKKSSIFGLAHNHSNNSQSNLQLIDQQMLGSQKQLKPPPIKIKGAPQKKNLLYNYADVKEWTYNNFSWDDKVKRVLVTQFGKEGFRPNQRAIVNCVLSKKDVFVCMPTGYGKSLTFQIPACVSEGVTIVIMPLLSLVYDQVTYLKNLGVQAENVCGQSKMVRYSEVKANNIKLIYTTPEKLEKSDQMHNLLKQLHEEGLLARFVIDEAHCVSKWGRDFRPDYLKLQNIRIRYPNTPIIALTATAPEEVKEDIIKLLQIVGCLYLQSSFNRPNLIYAVRKRDKPEKALLEIKKFIDSTYPRQSGIIYCLTQSDCENVSKELQKLNVQCNYYHAGISETKRNAVHEDWMTNEIQVIVATVAFGMGIDKKDCRFVIHYQMPKSIENYYQESGRAGRDGKLAHCILYYSQQDYRVNLLLIDKGELPAKLKKYNIDKLSQMEQFCNNQEDCRRQVQLSYLGERFERQNCNKTCDNCQALENEFDIINLTQECRKLLEFLSNNSVTEKQLETLLKGNNVQIKNNRKGNQLDTSQISGIFKKNPDYIQRVIHQLKSQEFIESKIVSVGGAKYKQKCVYLSTTAKKLYSFKELTIKVVRVKENQSDTERVNKVDKLTNDLFKKYLGAKKPGKQVTLTQFANKAYGSKQEGLKVYDSVFGYCNSDQYLEIKERLYAERKRLYKKQDLIQNIDLFLSSDDIEELCRKLPQTLEELLSPKVCIAMEIKKKDLFKNLIEEINHFVQTEEINKSLYQQADSENKTIQNQDEIFEFQQYIKESVGKGEDYMEDENITLQQYQNNDDYVDPEELKSAQIEEEEDLPIIQNLKPTTISEDDLNFLLSLCENE